MKNEIKYIIFDFDGVLVDTEYSTFLYYKKIFPNYGFSLKESDFKYKIGRKSIDFLKDVMGNNFTEELAQKLTKIKRDAFQQNIKKYLKPISDSMNFLEKANKQGFALAIGSQNEKVLLEKAIDVFGIRHFFKAIISLQDIKNKKPNPEVFLKTAEKLGIFPKEAVVIEDTPDGIKAARCGGFKVIGLTTSLSAEDLKTADLVVDSLLRINLEELKK